MPRCDIGGEGSRVELVGHQSDPFRNELVALPITEASCDNEAVRVPHIGLHILGRHAARNCDGMIASTASHEPDLLDGRGFPGRVPARGDNVDERDGLACDSLKVVNRLLVLERHTAEIEAAPIPCPALNEELSCSIGARTVVDSRVVDPQAVSVLGNAPNGFILLETQKVESHPKVRALHCPIALQQLGRRNVVVNQEGAAGAVIPCDERITDTLIHALCVNHNEQGVRVRKDFLKPVHN